MPSPAPAKLCARGTVDTALRIFRYLSVCQCLLGTWRRQIHGPDNGSVSDTGTAPNPLLLCIARFLRLWLPNDLTGLIDLSTISRD